VVYSPDTLGGRYTLVYMPLPYPPRYTPYIPRPPCTPSTSAPATALLGEESLGSEREKGLGMRRREAPLLLRCDGWCARLRTVTPLSWVKNG